MFDHKKLFDNSVIFKVVMILHFELNNIVFLFYKIKKMSELVKLEYVTEGVNRVTRSKGLGDSIEKFTAATGIKAVVEKISEVTGIPCGCKSRQEQLNNLVPYKN